MTVIPWVRAIDWDKLGVKATIVEKTEDFKFDGQEQTILVKRFKSEQLDDKENGNASYDLRVGEEYRKFGEPNTRPLRSGEAIQLLSGAGAIIRVLEEVQFPKKRFGQIVPRESWLQKGLANWTTKIDPGYTGPLEVTVFNYGAKVINLPYGEEFCALYVLEVGDGIVPYSGVSKSILGEPGRSWGEKASDWLRAKQPVVAAITAFLFLGSLVLGIINFFRVP